MISERTKALWFGISELHKQNNPAFSETIKKLMEDLQALPVSTLLDIHAWRKFIEAVSNRDLNKASAGQVVFWPTLSIRMSDTFFNASRLKNKAILLIEGRLAFEGHGKFYNILSRHEIKSSAAEISAL